MEDKEASTITYCVSPKAKKPLENRNLLVNQQKETRQPNPKKTTKGRQKIEIKEITDTNKKNVAFSKRRMGLFKKAAELSVLGGAQIGIIAFSRGGKIYTFGNVDVLIDKYKRKAPVMLSRSYSGDEVVEEDEDSMWWQRPVESVPEEDMVEYTKALISLRDNLLNRICAYRTVEMDTPVFPNPSHYEPDRNQYNPAGSNNEYIGFALPFMSHRV